MCLGHLFEVGRHDPHPIARRVVAADSARSLLEGPSRRGAISRTHGQNTRAPHHRHEVGFVQRAHPRQEIAEVLRRSRRVVGEAARCILCSPPASSGHPAGDGEVIVRDYGRDAMVEATLHHSCVMVEGCNRIEARLGFDARPLEGEAICIEAQLRQHRDVLGVPVVVITGVAGWFVERRVRCPLHRPQVGVDVSPLDLMAGCGRTPEEVARKRAHCNPPVQRPTRLFAVWHAETLYAKLCIEREHASSLHRAVPGKYERIRCDIPRMRFVAVDRTSFERTRNRARRMVEKSADGTSCLWLGTSSVRSWPNRDG